MRTLAFLAVTFLTVGCKSTPSCAEILAAGRPNGERVHTEPHSIAILEQGFDALLQRVILLRNARTSIDIQTFIWADDLSGRFFFDECVRAARRGVRVRILVDGMFCMLNGPAIAAGVASSPTLSFALYNPRVNTMDPGSRDTYPAIHWSPDRINHRMHTKVLIVDQRYLITGGRNVEDTYFDLNAGLNFQDRDIMVEGSVVTDSQTSSDRFFAHELVVDSSHLIATKKTNSDQRDYDALIAHPDLATLRKRIDERINGMGTWLSPPLTAAKLCYHVDPPGKESRQEDRVTMQAITYRICAAEEEILIQSPYFVTTSAGRDFFRKNEEKSEPLEIRVHTNSLAATDSWVTYSAFQREKRHLVYYDHLHLFEAMPRPRDIDSFWSMDPTAVALRARQGEGKAYICLHSKSMVLDRKVALIGSFNMDPRSANINTEVMLELDDPAIASRLARSILRDMSPQNAWVTAKRSSPLGRASINGLLARTSNTVSHYLMLDLWPITNTALFGLKDGEEPCSHSDPQFYERYEDLGSFPELGWNDKALSAEFFRMTGAVLVPTL